MQINTGRWTNDEHARFLQALDMFGKNWKRVEEYIGTRTSIQARSHAQKYFGKYFDRFNYGEIYY